ncbi:MAG: transposase [PVC group bacterium]|nr:transposase [PVC group bacterium]
MNDILSQTWFKIQTRLFPFFETEHEILTDNQRKLISILELIRIEEYVPYRWWSRGRSTKDRCKLARAFIAKVVLNIPTTKDLIDYLFESRNLRVICGYESRKEIPSESTFSRSFNEFSQAGLPFRVHEELIKKYEMERLVGHITRDATDIIAREKSIKKAKKVVIKRRPGRPSKGEIIPSKEKTRVEKQLNMSLEEMICELPKDCDVGFKHKRGKPYFWKGYKFHVDWADGEIPISCILTSASLNDSQAAIPLATMTSKRVQNLYDLMDSAYDSRLIREHSRKLGHVPIIEHNRRKGKIKIEMEPAEKRRFNERYTAERGFSLLKDKFGGSMIRVKNHEKIFTHLMFSILALTAERLLNLLV